MLAETDALLVRHGLPIRAPGLDPDAIAARKGVESGVAVLWPAVDGEVTLGDQDDAAHPLRLERVEVRAQHRRSGGPRRRDGGGVDIHDVAGAHARVAAAAGPRIVTDAGGSASATVCTLSADGTTLTFEANVTGAVVSYMPRPAVDMDAAWPSI